MTATKLIVGLGNPGREYENTRHNYGVIVLKALLEEFGRLGQVTQLSGQKDPFLLWRYATPGMSCLLAAPLTYMNRSGEAVQRISAYYRIASQDTLVLHDELDLPLGRMKLKKGGGNAGHNGLKSIQQMLATPDFYRLRLGIDKKAGQEGASYVLARFTREEDAVVARCTDAAIRGLFLFLKGDFAAARQYINSFSAVPEPAKDAFCPEEKKL